MIGLPRWARIPPTPRAMTRGPLLFDVSLVGLVCLGKGEGVGLEHSLWYSSGTLPIRPECPKTISFHARKWILSLGRKITSTRLLDFLILDVEFQHFFSRHVAL